MRYVHNEPFKAADWIGEVVRRAEITVFGSLDSERSVRAYTKTGEVSTLNDSMGLWNNESNKHLVLSCHNTVY
jgi:hypothetical protein